MLIDYSWQVRSVDCFAKIVDKTLLKEGSTGIPKKVVPYFIGRTLKEGESVYIELAVGNLNIMCKISRQNNRHRLFIAELRGHLISNLVKIDDLLIFDRSYFSEMKFHVSSISSTNKLLISPLDTEIMIGEDIATSARRRVGQEAFRELLLRRFKRTCCLSGVPDVTDSKKSILTASHIKPWVLADKFEKVDPYNGLLLAPQYDALFDKGLISFDDEGNVIKSGEVNSLITEKWELKRLKLKPLSQKTAEYMSFHRNHFNY
jgi:hypothetical protein